MDFNQYFNIEDKEYVNIPLNSDIQQFVDPNRIKLLKSTTFNAEEAESKIKQYFFDVFDLYTQGKKSEAIDLLDVPREINATHLGLSKGESRGTGPSREILSQFFEKITAHGQLKQSLLSRPVLIPLFVKNFGPERFSDLIVNIISKELADFTKRICVRHKIDTYVNRIDATYYDIKTRKWQPLVSELPIGPDEKPILLVPDELAINKYGFSAEKYVSKVILVYLQDKHLAKNSSLVTYKEIKGDLTPVKPTKKMLYKVEVRDAYDELGKVKKFALDQSLENPHLLEQYIDLVEGKVYKLKKKD